MRKWGPFIMDYFMMMDGDGTLRHLKYPGAFSQQPWVDMQVYAVIRSQHQHLQNQKIKKAQQEQKARMPKKGGGLKRLFSRRR